MSKSTFTPGPWLLKRQTAYLRGACKIIQFHFYAMGNYKREPDPEPGITSVSALELPLNITAFGATSEADAQMAACAPELVECLEEFIDHAHEFLSQSFEPDWITRAREVMSRAKGGRRGKRKNRTRA